MKDKRFNSKLIPFFHLIYVLKNDGGTYRGISEYLKNEYAVNASPKSIFQFLKVRNLRGIKPSLEEILEIKNSELIKMVQTENLPQRDNQNNEPDILGIP